MEIKDASALYDFLGKIGYIGSIGFSLILIAILGYLLSNTTEKLIDEQHKKLRLRIVLISLVIVFGGSIVIISNSVEKQEEVSNANAIKNYMIANNWKWFGFRRMALEINFKDLPAIDTAINRSGKSVPGKYDNSAKLAEAVEQRVKDITKWVDCFPEEFIKGKVSDDFYRDFKDTFGIELIDTTALNIIDKHNEEMLPFYRSKVLNYMKSNKPLPLDTMYYNEIGNDVDSRLQNFLIDKMISKYTNDFIPISVYDSTNTWREALRINKDSVVKK